VVGHGSYPQAAAYPGKSQARKFTAAIAMPTPKSTPASTRLEPPFEIRFRLGESIVKRSLLPPGTGGAALWI